MKFKFPLFLSVIFLVSLSISAFAGSISLADSLTATQIKTLKLVKVGPPMYYLPPPVDSVLLRKLALEKYKLDIDNRYLTKAAEEISISNFQNIQSLSELLETTDVHGDLNETSIATINQLLESSRSSGDMKNLALLLDTYGVYYAKKGDFDKSAGYFLESLHTSERTGDKAAQSRLAINLAALYKMSGRYDEALTYNEYAIRVNTVLKKQLPIAIAYANIASVYGLQKKFAESERYILRKALPLFQHLGSKTGRMICFENLAEMYALQNHFSEAKWYYLQASLMADILNDTDAKIATLVNLAEVKNAIGDHALALSDFKQAETLATHTKYLSRLVEIKGDMGDTYRKMGNYSAAENAIGEYSQLKATLFESQK